jgi:hypothetical protein
VLALRAQDRSIEEIAAALAAAGTPVSAQTVCPTSAVCGHLRADSGVGLALESQVGCP